MCSMNVRGLPFVVCVCVCVRVLHAVCGVLCAVCVLMWFAVVTMASQAFCMMASLHTISENTFRPASMPIINYSRVLCVRVCF